MIDDAKLLRTYAENHDEQAFANLVKRYVNLVYSAALRQTGGDIHLAEDIAQTVFTDLARKARFVELGLKSGKPLVAWLYTSTRFASSHARRSEERRRARETVAYAMNDDSYVSHTVTESLWSDLKPLLGRDHE